MEIKFYEFISQSFYSFLSGKKVSTPKADSRQKPFLFFVKKRNKKTTPFRIRNSLVKIFSKYLESPSLRVGLKPVFDERSNLNLVKSFLTSITFDSLSRKIKNPCLVIKKFKLIKEIFKMSILKTKTFFTYLVVGALVTSLYVSCKSNEEPAAVEIPSQYYGTWVYGATTNRALLIEVERDSSSYLASIWVYDREGSLIGSSILSHGGIDANATVDFGPNVTKNSDTSWTLQDCTFSFSSSTSGTLSYYGNDYVINKQ